MITRGDVIFHLFLALFAAGMLAVVIYGLNVESRNRDACEAMGGEYVPGRSYQMCIRDGLILEVYR